MAKLGWSMVFSETTTNLLQWSILKRSARTTKSSEPLETKKGKGGAGGGNRTHGLGIMRLWVPGWRSYSQ